MPKSGAALLANWLPGEVELQESVSLLLDYHHPDALRPLGFKLGMGQDWQLRHRPGSLVR